jgi:hypothetical protein
MGTALNFVGVLSLRVTRRALFEQKERKGRRARATSAERRPMLFDRAWHAGVHRDAAIREEAAANILSGNTLVTFRCETPDRELRPT